MNSLLVPLVATVIVFAVLSRNLEHALYHVVYSRPSLYQLSLGQVLHLTHCSLLTGRGMVEQVCWIPCVSTVQVTSSLESVVTYEEKPRDQWIFEYPAQVVLARLRRSGGPQRST